MGTTGIVNPGEEQDLATLTDQQMTCGYTSFDAQMSQPRFNKNSV